MERGGSCGCHLEPYSSLSQAELMCRSHTVDTSQTVLGAQPAVPARLLLPGQAPGSRPRSQEAGLRRQVLRFTCQVENLALGTCAWEHELAVRCFPSVGQTQAPQALSLCGTQSRQMEEGKDVQPSPCLGLERGILQKQPQLAVPRPPAPDVSCDGDLRMFPQVSASEVGPLNSRLAQAWIAGAGHQ